LNGVPKKKGHFWQARYTDPTPYTPIVTTAMVVLCQISMAKGNRSSNNSLTIMEAMPELDWCKWATDALRKSSEEAVESSDG